MAIVAFFIGVVPDFPAWTVDRDRRWLVVACVVLPLPIVFGYGVEPPSARTAAADGQALQSHGCTVYRQGVRNAEGRRL